VASPRKEPSHAHSTGKASTRLRRTPEAATYLSISKRTLWTLTNVGEIPSIRFGIGSRKAVRYDIADLDAWIEAKKNGGAR
jgi:excisionase family DNA binding protein